ncbi:MAG: hypothetical protein P8Z35_10525, partial [Ignavibacteriaceae bacterium]
MIIKRCINELSIVIKGFNSGMNSYCRYLTILLFVFILILEVKAQNITNIKKISDFAAVTRDYLEGYTQSTESNDFTYHCFRNDLSECLLTRCTTGNMAIEWNTQPVPYNYGKEEVGFVWVAAI